MSEDQNDITQPRDKVLADTGWGLTPADQATQKHDANGDPTIVYNPAAPDAVGDVMRGQRRVILHANRVRVEPGRTVIIDINGDVCVVEGLSYGDPNLVVVLNNLGAAFDPRFVGSIPADDTKTREYELSRAWAWGDDR